jgi:hypothetical protein
MKHKDILIAIAEGKKVEFYLNYSAGGKWEVPDDLEEINPLSCPDDMWRIKDESPKHQAWNKLSRTAFEHNHHAFVTGWTAALMFQHDNGLIEDFDLEHLNR